VRLFFYSFLLFFSLKIFAQEKVIPVIIDGDQVSYSQDEQKVLAKGNVIIKHEDTVIRCDQASYEVEANKAYLEGNVEIIREKEIITGRKVIYNFGDKTAQIEKMRAQSPPFYGEAREGEKISDNEYLFKDGYITTCDLKKPHYRIKARRITIYPGERVVAKNVFVLVSNIPVFYTPYYSQSLKDQFVELSVGKNKEWGYHVLSRWRYHLNQENKGRVYLDLYEERGKGIGVVHKTESENIGDVLFKYYFIQDKLYEVDKRNSFFEFYSEREDIASKYLEDDRYRLQLYYEGRPFPELSIKSEFHKFSDQYFTKDFFYREYEIESSPSSYLLLERSFSNSSLSLIVRKRANHFFSETERFPEVEYNFYRQKLGLANLYLESKSSFSNLITKTANSHVDNDVVRGYSHNVFSYPTSIKWLQINPYVGAYTAFYSKKSSGDENVFRFAHESGVSFSTKLYKYFDVDFNLFGERIKKMRHVLTPTLSYSYMHSPTIPNSQIFQIDDIDSLERANSASFKLENRLQVKSKESKWDPLYFAPQVNYQINEEGKGSYFSSIDTELEFYPKKGVALGVTSKYNVPIRRFTEFNADITFKELTQEPSDKESLSAWGPNYLSLGHSYTRQESSQGTLDLSYKLTPKIYFKNYLRYEYNTGDFKEQKYALRLDLHCWWLDLGLDIDNQRPDKEFTFWVVFKLKAFPEKIHFGYDHTYKGMGDRI
jgi:lipopolysaccharide assembly outer membrane protein LptD (OstA)